MNRFLGLLFLFVIICVAGCSEQNGDYVAASSISQDGFARDAASMRAASGQVVKLWGFVDHSNLYGDQATKAILGDWWGGDGPDAETWRFNLKAHADDQAGASFPVYIPNDTGRDDLLKRFLADAQAAAPTKVFVTGRIFTFGAPTNLATRTGLYMELDSSDDVQPATDPR